MASSSASIARLLRIASATRYRQFEIDPLLQCHLQCIPEVRRFDPP
jgi:hypothetical protein